MVVETLSVEIQLELGVEKANILVFELLDNN